MKPTLTILDARSVLTPYYSQIQLEFERAFSEITEHLDLRSIDVTVSAYSPEKCSPFGIGGFGLNGHRVEVFLDASRSDLTEVISKELLAVLGHELNHSVRKSLQHPESQLQDLLVLEGLACHFEQVLANGAIPSMFVDVQQYDWQELYRAMKNKLTSSEFNFQLLFLATEQQSMPRYAGYWVGYNLVKNYADFHKLSPRQLITVPTNRFIEFYEQYR